MRILGRCAAASMTRLLGPTPVAASPSRVASQLAIEPACMFRTDKGLSAAGSGEQRPPVNATIAASEVRSK